MADFSPACSAGVLLGQANVISSRSLAIWSKSGRRGLRAGEGENLHSPGPTAREMSPCSFLVVNSREDRRLDSHD